MDENWTWTKNTFVFDGKTYTEWYGESPYHMATVTNFPGAWRGIVHTVQGNQNSPYRKTAQACKNWCEGYGRNKRRKN